MKRLICAALACTLVLALSACNGGTGGARSAVASGSTSGSTDANKGPISIAAPASDVSLEEQVLLDEQGVKITATGFGYDNDRLRYLIGLTIDNQSGQDIEISHGSSFINGYFSKFTLIPPDDEYNVTTDGIKFEGSVRVKDGQTVQAQTSFNYFYYLTSGRDDELPEHLLTSFVVCEWEGVPLERSSTTYSTLIRSDTVEIVTSLSGGAMPDPVLVGDEVYRDDNVVVTASEVVYTDYPYSIEAGKDQYSINLHVKNIGAQNISVGLEDASINGFLLESGYTTVGDTLIPQTVTDLTLPVTPEDRENAGIESIEDTEALEFRFVLHTVGDNPEWPYSELLTTDPITLDTAWLTEHYTTASEQDAARKIQ